MIFIPYESKPITRMAFQITKNHVIIKPKAPDGCIYSIGYIGLGNNVVTKPIEFKAYEHPVVGDWIVRLTAEDTYHCTDAVFRDRNTVP
jgi:hypothetical protein